MNAKAIKIIEYGKFISKLVALKHHELARKYDLTLEQFHLLIELDELELDVAEDAAPPTVGQIAETVGNAPHTLSERIKRLGKKGLIEKVKDAKDLRINRVVLTPAGRELLDKISREAFNNFMYGSLEEMGEESLGNLLECLEQLVEILQRGAGNNEFGTGE
ncbi:MAG TPA: MarR family winged helix-turn-helix transcriptional regulator [Selenomonadales bacterium]|nr:MarR family winged helix-turn-helix transcriptional regulator [Selenomonadales bacterium]